jgi:hypothetical protein
MLECRMTPREGSLLIASSGTSTQTHVTGNYAQLAQPPQSGGEIDQGGWSSRRVAAAALAPTPQAGKPRSWYSEVAGASRETCGERGKLQRSTDKLLVIGWIMLLWVLSFSRQAVTI